MVYATKTVQLLYNDRDRNAFSPLLLKSHIMKNVINALLLLSLYFPINSYANNTPVKILPLGDSITCASKYKTSYRYPLWTKLVDANKQIKFIGSQTKEGNNGRVWKPYKNLPFPEANEGHSGWRADQVLKGLNKDIKGLEKWIRGYQPDIALIHLGTNDMHQKQTPESTRDEIEQIIEILRMKNPRIKVLLAQIIPLLNDPNVPRFNQLLAQLANKLNQPNSPVVTVDMYSGFSLATDVLQHDKIHPSAQGEEKMAQRWFTALIHPQILGH